MTQSKLLNSALEFVEEQEAVVLERYAGFGRELFRELFSCSPEFRSTFRYFRNADGTDDVWAICNFGTVEFGVQLDPDIEVICIWDESWHDEIGEWVGDPIRYSTELIRSRCFNKA